MHPTEVYVCQYAFERLRRLPPHSPISCTHRLNLTILRGMKKQDSNEFEQKHGQYKSQVLTILLDNQILAHITACDIHGMYII
jgi:hypothetical protein